jgi:hypothetical protein
MRFATSPTVVPPSSLRRGIATLWIILVLPAMFLMICYAVESGRLYLARQQLQTALESAALASVKDWCDSRCDEGTQPARECGLAFALANDILGTPLSIDLNFDSSDRPNENANCEGNLLFGTITETDPEVVFDTSKRAGCGRLDGPNAHATMKISTDGWQTVMLCERNYDCMVVIATPVYTEADPPAVVRITNVSANSFDFIVQETNAGVARPDVPVYFFIAEAGVYNEADHGVKMEVVKFNSTVTDFANNSWNAQAMPYAQAYTQPVVLGQVMSYNDPDWSVFWSHGGSRNIPPGANLFVGKHVGQDADRTRADETIGYVVIEEGDGCMNGLPYHAELGPDAVSGILPTAPDTYTTPTDICHFVVAVKEAEAGGNGAWAVLYGPDPLRPGAIDLALDEHRLTDRRHTNEPVAYILFGGPCAVRARAEIQVNWMCQNLFGCLLPPTTITAEVTAVMDCEKRCTQLICVDRFECP